MVRGNMVDKPDIEKFAALVREADSIAVLTGAGISTPSGIPDFRSASGIYSNEKNQNVFDIRVFQSNPEFFYQFARDFYPQVAEAEPNAAHKTLAAWEERGMNVRIATQNIDDLHERGGSPEVIHMHGQILRALCAECGHQWGWAGAMELDDLCHSCGTVGTVRPDVVWFGEMPYHMETIMVRAGDCDLFVAIGTSGSVYPAAGFVTEARHRGVRTLEINLEPSENAHDFDDRLLGPASETVPVWVAGLLKGGR